MNTTRLLPCCVLLLSVIAADAMASPQNQEERRNSRNTPQQRVKGTQTNEQPAGVNDGPFRDPVEVGQEAARQILEKIILIRGELGERESDRPLRVAVFPFVNAKGEVMTATRDAATALAGELSRELGRSDSPAFEFASPIEVANLPPQLLSGHEAPGDAEAQAVLNALKCDYLVTGRFNADSAAALLAARQPVVTFQLSLHIPKLPVVKMSFEAETRSIQTADADPIGPFPLELISNGNSLMLKPEEREGLGTVYVADITRPLVGRPFSLHLTSQGRIVGYRNRDPRLEESRLFGVSVFVNGVCSLGQPMGDGNFGLGWGHWSQTPRHALTAPGFAITDTADGPQVERQRQQPEDSSVLEVDNYRTSSETVPLTFTMPSSGEGLITVYLFAEKLAGDRRIPRGDEAMIPTQFKPVKLVPWYNAPLLHAPPVLTHRIVYRLK